MNIGILTGGGDCPGLNPAIRGVVRRSISDYNYNCFGIKNGWDGLIKGDIEPLTLDAVSGILIKGGTILGTSRTNPLKSEEDMNKIKENIKKFDINVIVAIGGDDTLSVAAVLSEQGIPCVGLPKTIDNDISGTDYTFGFDTAVTVATDAIDRLHTTAESHHRVMVCEVMGRHAGWIATWAGIAGGADYILIPEQTFTIEEIVNVVNHRNERGKNFSIIVVAEGAKLSDEENYITASNEVDAFGHVMLGGIGEVIGKAIKKETGMDTRVTKLGHIQRGGSPTAFDRVLATRFGVAAADLVHEKYFGQMVALQRNEIVSIPIKEAIAESKTVDMEIYNIAKVFFG
ncbi:6-phosphofructokinase [candidate division KSB1 bacterium]